MHTYYRVDGRGDGYAVVRYHGEPEEVYDAKFTDVTGHETREQADAEAARLAGPDALRMPDGTWESY